MFRLLGATARRFHLTAGLDKAKGGKLVGVKKRMKARGKMDESIGFRDKQGRLEARADMDFMKHLKKGNYEEIVVGKRGGLASKKGLELLSLSKLEDYQGKNQDLRPTWKTITTRHLQPENLHEVKKVAPEIAKRYAHMIHYRQKIPREVDIRVPLEVVLPNTLTPVQKKLRQKPENRTDEDNELVQRQGVELVDMLEKGFAEQKIDIVRKRMTGLKEYVITIVPSQAFIEKYQVKRNSHEVDDFVANSNIQSMSAQLSTAIDVTLQDLDDK